MKEKLCMEKEVSNNRLSDSALLKLHIKGATREEKKIPEEKQKCTPDRVPTLRE